MIATTCSPPARALLAAGLLALAVSACSGADAVGSSQAGPSGSGGGSAGGGRGDGGAADGSTTGTQAVVGSTSSGDVVATVTSSGDGGSDGTGASDGGAPQGPSTGTMTGGGEDSTSTGFINPCGSECGDEELCDGVHRGLDDDCDGEVDEGCPCRAGESSDCFKGDPSYADEPGCFPGTMKCLTGGTWSECNGGSHAWGPDPCTEPSESGCHPISAVPFQVVNLIDGTGVFSMNADAGSQTWEVDCPAGVDPCPAIGGAAPMDDFQALQSGEYTVTYSKTVAGQPSSCTYPLYVGARGMRVELSWEFATSTDLDLHMMQPGVASVFNSGGSATDCTWNNCTIDEYAFGTGPEWFPASAPLGEPVAWYLDPDPNLNSCYFAPRGVGQDWADNGDGCHNPRLDLDNVSCSVGVSDPNSSSFCAAENVNIDFPPVDAWTRLGVVHYSGNVNRPTLRVFCDGALRAVLGPEGFATPVETSSQQPKQVWLAADVRWTEGECSRECEVLPIYRDADLQTAWIDPAPAGGPPFPQ